MKKRFFYFPVICFLFSIFCVGNLFSASGVLWGETDIRYISTQWFDIIFPSRSVQSAMKLYDCADQIYEDICADLGTTPQFRMDVTLTPSTDVFNAYFTNYSSNHIVLYDTVPDEDLSVFENDIEGTFRHELNHAVTINMRNKFWTGLDSVFGDTYNFGCYITMPSLIKEGASVSEESRYGEGRLNDGFYLHMLKQSILQGDFPSYTEVTGARDVYPSGTLPYSFGGPFIDWLKKTYGMEKYAQFWYQGINMGAVTYSGAFKKVYGIPIKKAWEEFEASVSVPQICAEPSDSPGVSYLQGGHTPLAVYTSLASSEKGFAWIEKKSSSVWFAPVNDGEIGKSKKVFSLKNISSLSLSADGNFFAVNSIGTNYGNYKNETFVYDTKNKKLVKFPETSLRDSCVVKVDDGYHLVSPRTENNKTFLCDWKMVFKKEKLSSFQFVGEYDFDGKKIFSPVDCGNGKIGFILRDENGWSVCLMELFQDYENFSVKKIGMEKNCSIRNLSLDKSDSEKIKLNFSWASVSVFPRLGSVTFDNQSAELEFMNEDISGGIYFPTTVPEFDSLVCIGNFVSENRIMEIKKCEISNSKKIVPVEKISFEKNDSVQKLQAAQEFLDSTETYKGGLEKGMIIPFSWIPVYDKNSQEKGGIYFPGVSYVCKNPWDGVTLNVMAGINPGKGIFNYFQDNNFEAGLAAEISGGSESSIFNYSVLAQALFDKNGFSQSSLRTQVISELHFGRTGSIIFQNIGNFMFGREPGENVDEKYLSVSDSFIMQLGSVIKSGPGPFQKKAFLVQLSSDLVVRNSFTSGPENNLENVLNYVHVYPSFVFYIPNLIPVNCTEQFTFNLPVHLVFSIAPSKSQLFGAYASVMLFSWEIQTGPTFFPIYFNRFVSTLSYVCGLLDLRENVSLLNLPSKILYERDFIYADYLRLTASLQCTPNTGAMASTSVMGTLGASFNFYPRETNNSKRFSVSVSTSLNF